MNVLFIGGTLDGQIIGFVPKRHDDIRVRIGEEDVEFYRLDNDTEIKFSHMRAIAHYYRTGTSANSLVDLWEWIPE